MGLREVEIREEKIAALETELQQTRLDASKVVHALNCAVLLIDALIAWLPAGMDLSERVKTCKADLDRAMRVITGKP